MADGQVEIRILGAVDPSLSTSITEAADKIEAMAQKSGGTVGRVWTEVEEKKIQGQEKANAASYALGQESADAMRDQAIKLENDLSAIQQRAQPKPTGGKSGGGAGGQTAQQELLAQERANRVAAIDDQYAERKQQLLQQETREFIEAEQQQLSAATSALDQEYKAHQISASERASAEIGLTQQTQKEIDARLASDMNSFNADSKAYNALESEKEKIDQEFTKRHSEAIGQMTQEETQKWTSMLGPFNNVFSQMLSGHTSWTNMIASLDRSLIMKLIETTEQDVIAWLVGEQAKTAATNAGNAARTASSTAAAAESAGAEGGWMKSSAIGHAYSAAVAAWDATAQIPFVGPILAPAAAAAALAATLALAGNIPSFATGSWELPHDTLAQVHKGEMIVPAGAASSMRSGFSMSGAAATNNNANATSHAWNYAPTINGVPERNVMDELRNNSGEFMSFVRGLTRGGSMKFG